MDYDDSSIRPLTKNGSSQKPARIAMVIARQRVVLRVDTKNEIKFGLGFFFQIFFPGALWFWVA